MNNIISLILVNFITFTRVIGTFLMPIISKEFTVYSIIVYLIVLLLTDALDGFLARRLKVSSIFGALLDAAADKLLGIAYLCLIANKYPVLFLPVVVEVIIILNNLIGATNGSTIETTWLGKCKTWLFGVLTVLAFIICYSNDLIFFKSINFIINNKDYLMGLIAGIMSGVDFIVAINYYHKVRLEVKQAKVNNIKKEEYRLKKGKDLVHALFDYDHYMNTLNEPLLVRLGDKL